MTTFEILDEFKAVNDLAQEVEYNEETGEVIDNTELIQELLTSLDMSKEAKLDNVEYVKRDFKAKEDALGVEIKRLQERKKQMQNKQKQLTQLQEFLLGGEKCKTTKFTFSFRETPSTEIVDEGALPEAYLKVEFKVNKTEIKKVLLAGGAIEGAELKYTKTLGVR